MHTIEYDVIVIGAGLSGFHTALKLAEEGYQAIVLERNELLMAEASLQNFARIHHGWHYPPSLATAQECIPAAFEFLREFGGVLIAGQQSRFQRG